MHTDVFAQRGGMCVAFVAALHLAKVRLVRGVHVHVLLAVGAVGKPPVTSVEFAFKWLFTLNLQVIY